MALWGKTDASGSKPKYLLDADKEKTVFVSTEEAQLKTNKDKGIHGAGWWKVMEYVDNAGMPRYKAECLVAMTVPNSVSGDAADDEIVADTEVTVEITQQPTNQWYWNQNPAVFTVVAEASSGTVTYQWETAAPGSNDWSLIEDATTDTYTADLPDEATGTQFRVIVGSTDGAVKVVSDIALAQLD